MIKICFYGCCGHSVTVFDSQRTDLSFAGCCPGGEGEPGMDSLMAQAARRGQEMRPFPSLEEMLEQAKPQVLVVDNSYGCHLSPSLAALKRGIGVYCDKPGVTTLEELELLRESIRKNDGVFWTMQTMRYEPTFYTAWRQVRQGKIGKVRLINGQKSYKLGTRPPFFYDPLCFGGTIPWVGIHGIDLAMWMADCFSCTQCIGKAWAPEERPCPEMTALSLLQLGNGVLCSVSADYLRPQSSATHGDDRLRVVGEKGIIEVLFDQVTLHTQEEAVPRELPLETPLPIFDDFLNALENKGQGILFSMEQALSSTEAALRCQISSETL